MPIVADTYPWVVGVDTHAATHHYAILEARTGALLADASFPTNPQGLRRAAAWVARRTRNADPAQVLCSVEGTRSYGAQLTTLLLQIGYRVIDAPSPKRERGSAKTDRIDAEIAARGILHRRVERLADARSGETSATLQIELTARQAMTGERTREINRLTALLRTYDLGVDVRRALTRATIRTVAGWRPRPSDTPVAATARAHAIRHARRILDLEHDLAQNKRDLTRLVRAARPSLLTLCGVGPVNAAIVLTAWSHPGRIHTDAGFAKLGGACPLEISSGQRHEHRLNRTGDRQLNRALHTIANHRMRYDPATRDYLTRRTADKLTKPRIRRCLKRYIARELFNHLQRLDNP